MTALTLPYLLGFFALSALVAWVTNQWELRAWRRSAGLHWTERSEVGGQAVGRGIFIATY